MEGGASLEEESTGIGWVKRMEGERGVVWLRMGPEAAGGVERRSLKGGRTWDMKMQWI